MQITAVRFGLPNLPDCSGPNDEVRLTRASYTHKISCIPTAILSFTLPNPKAALGRFNFENWMKRQAVLQLLSQSGTPVKYALEAQIIGLVTRVESVRNSADQITDLTIELVSWPSGHRAADPATIYTKGYRFFQNMSSIDIAEQLIKNIGGFVFKYLSPRSNTINKRDYEVQYGESDFEFIKRILAEDGLLFSVSYHDTLANTFPTEEETTYFHIFDDIKQFVAIDQVDVTNTIDTNPKIGLRTGLYNKIEYYEPGTDEISLVTSHSESSNVDYRKSSMTPDLATRLSRHRRSKWREVSVHSTYRGSSASTIAMDYSAFLNRISSLMRESNASPVQEFSFDAHALKVGKNYGLRNVRDYRLSILEARYAIHIEPDNSNYIFTSQIVCKKSNGAHYTQAVSRPVLPGLLRGVVLSSVDSPSYATYGTDSLVHADEFGRIQVRILWHGESISNEAAPTDRPWLRLMTPWAGQGAGFIAFPRDGQEVVISFINGDASQPIVLGCMYGETASHPNQAPWRISDDPLVARGMRPRTSHNSNQGSGNLKWIGLGTHQALGERKGQFIRLDGTKTNPQGVEISSAGSIDIQAQTDMVLEAINSSALKAKDITVGTKDYTEKIYISAKHTVIEGEHKDTMHSGTDQHSYQEKITSGSVSAESWTSKTSHVESSKNSYGTVISTYGSASTTYGVKNSNSALANNNHILAVNFYGAAISHFGYKADVAVIKSEDVLFRKYSSEVDLRNVKLKCTSYGASIYTGGVSVKSLVMSIIS